MLLLKLLKGFTLGALALTMLILFVLTNGLWTLTNWAMEKLHEM